LRIILKKTQAKLTGLANSVIVFSVEQQWVLKRATNLNHELIEQFLTKIYEIFSQTEEISFEQTPFSGSKSPWQAPFIHIVIPKTERRIPNFEREQMFKFMKRTCSQNYKDVAAFEATHFGVASSFDCTLAISVDESKYDTAFESFVILFKLICGDFFILEQVVKKLRFLLGNENKFVVEQSFLSDKTEAEVTAEKKLQQLRDLMKKFYRATTFLSPEDYGTEETDLQYIHVLVSGWKERETKERAVQHVNAVERIYELQADEERAIIEKKRSRREKMLNTGILWLGVLSVAGTVAAVVQFIDFDNENTTKIARICVVVLTVLLAIGLFLYFQLSGLLKKPKKH